ncbi:MAG: cell division protein FtsH, partial [Desulfobacterales bacterium]|nr:cell division protein FtsH [Desulfobacterales bacterium]
MEKKYKFSVWYVLIGIWIVLLIQNYLGSMLAIRTITYSEFLGLLKQNKVAEVAISANQIQGKLKAEGEAEGKEQLFKTVRVDPEISKLLEQYG